MWNNEVSKSSISPEKLILLQKQALSFDLRVILNHKLVVTGILQLVLLDSAALKYFQQPFCGCCQDQEKNVLKY